jgi:diaminohydroxyphosphoribosylaminopyrimidine deaminase/5-amino-6-(5-phosphoribosylamino)uracil reductase
MIFDQKYMQRCLELAQFGGGYVAPNPMVGSVLVFEDQIIGEGYHQRYGEPHAEPNAIADVKQTELIPKSTLYVNLEPCSHFGKTPPCASLIVKHGIKKVVIGTLDPNPKVAGKGVEILRAAGIEVQVGVLEAECRSLNKRFFIFQEQKRPYILLKWAQTQNGFIDRIRESVNEPPLVISNPITRQLTHQMRSENQAILVGTNTVLLDNPSLTVRNWPGKSPVRIAIDREGKIPSNYHLLDGSISTLIFTEQEKQNHASIEYIQIKFDENCLQTILQKIYERNIHSVLVEGGAKLLNCFIQNDCWDEANVEVSPLCIESGISAPILGALPVSTKIFNNHKWLFYQNKNYNF